MKRLVLGRLSTENQMWLSVMFLRVFFQNRWLKLVSSFVPATGISRSIWKLVFHLMVYMFIECYWVVPVPVTSYSFCISALIKTELLCYVTWECFSSAPMDLLTIPSSSSTASHLSQIKKYWSSVCRSVICKRLKNQDGLLPELLCPYPDRNIKNSMVQEPFNPLL